MKLIDFPRKSDVDQLKKNTNQLFKIVFERIDDLEESLPAQPKDRKRIGLKGTTNL